MARTTSNGRKKAATRAGGSRQATKNSREPRLDPSTRNDIYGIALAALAIALAIAVLGGGGGVVSGAIATALRTLVGIGAYLLPVAILLWAVSFFVRFAEITEWRVAAGLALTTLSIISMTALNAPPDTMWDRPALEAYGGWIGAGLAWVLRSLLGQSISFVALGALLLIGLVVTGLSVSGLVDAVRLRIAARSSETVTEPSAPRQRAPKTLPLEDIEPSTDRTPRRAARDKERTPDPEARRKTIPTPRTVAPRAMEGFELPSMTMLDRTSESASGHQASERELKETASLIEDTLSTFDIPSRVVDWIAGPTVTLFEVALDKGIKVNRVTSLADDLALALAASTVRILAPIPGKRLVGIEVPNERRSTVTLGDVLAGAPMLGEAGPLALAIGKDVSGDSVLADLATMPHLLIAGSTGTGKSVCINALLMSILMRTTPAEVRLILIDPKRIELSLYNGVPHLYVPVVTEPKEAASALAWAVSEMERRLKVLQKAGTRNIGMYNAWVQSGKAEEGAEELPYLVIVIDELADLMMVAAREVEDSICRIAQLARAAGIHLIVATQRPSTDIITGLIKTNITNRIAFAVGSGIDSRVILDQPGAEKLVGMGDMLFATPAWPKPKRIQGAFVSEREIEEAVTFLKDQGEPDYHEEILHLKIATAGGGVDSGEEDDPLLWEAADIVLTAGMGSTSLLQRRLKVGYARAGRIMDMLEAKGVVGPPDGSKPRDVLVDVAELEALKAFERLEEGESGE